MFFTSCDQAGAEKIISKADAIMVLDNFIVLSSAGPATGYCALNVLNPKEHFFTLLCNKV